MWNYKKHKTSSNQQELQAVIRLRELCMYNYPAERFIDEFKTAMEAIKRKNNFQASYAYQAEIIDNQTVEVWKMKVNSDKNYLMFTLTKGDDIPGPFDNL